MTSRQTAIVLGFGGRAPLELLDLLYRSRSECGIKEIIPRRSQSIEYSLLEAPYRTFLHCSIEKVNDLYPKEISSLLVYCLPASVTEYVRFSSEADFVRTKILNGAKNENVVVATYDTESDSFLGGSINDVLASVKGDEEKKSAFAIASLTALSKLDVAVAESAVVSPQKKDIIIVVGSGGREHALAVALAKSPLVSEVVCCPGNGGTASEENAKIKNKGNNQSNDTVISLTKEIGAKMVVVGPEAPLVGGLVDQLKIECPDILCFGPTKAAAELEASKAFSKDFLQEHNIPTAKYRTFTDPAKAIRYVESLDDDDRQVVKASGLAAGKGVLLPTSKEETIAAVKKIMSDKSFGSAGDVCVIESFLKGPEASCFAFCDGKTAVLMPAAQDHKRALDNDEGLNTGGMGAYAPAPCVTPDLLKEIEAICIKTVEKMAERGTPYVGLLYAGMMLTPNGPNVLEFNCRFGDPETQVVLPLLETDLYEIMTACCTGKLDSVDVRFKESTSALTVVCAAKGYPLKYKKGMKINGLKNADAIDDVKVYHAGTKIDENSVMRCSGGRVLAVTGTGPDLKSSIKKVYEAVAAISFVEKDGSQQIYFRTDIGRKALQKKLRIGVLGSTRGTAMIPVIEACASGSLHAEIVSVISNKSGAPILDKGNSLGANVVSKFVSAKGLTQVEFDAECTAALVAARVEYLLLVGYMRILSPSFCKFWTGRCINVHPSLLPKHAGGMDLHVHQAVLDEGDDETGCTIHEVTEDVDGGPIVLQKKVVVGKNETAESLKVKVQALEGPAFVEAIKSYMKQRAVVSYSDAGVSIDAGSNLVEMIKPFCKATRRPGCEADLGGFGGLFDLAAAGYDAKETVLIGATDGVGTKLRIAQATNNHFSVGIDLVAMCVNDLIVAGGEPLFFLDYFATGRLEVNEAAEVVRGIAEGCVQAGCGLIGGETAEMPSLYASGDYDLAGFSVGAVSKNKILPQNVVPGDILLGLSSSGIHSNGFSLVRKLIEKEGLTYGSPCPWDSNVDTVAESLLTPTKIYCKACLPLLKKGIVKGMSHITGGGLLENLPRSLPEGTGAEISNHPCLPGVFAWMKNASGLDDDEMLRTFNCGVGMVLIVDKACVTEAKSMLHKNGEDEVFDLGAVVEQPGIKFINSLNTL